MESQMVSVEGIIVDRLSKSPVPAVLVEAWDSEQKFKEVIACAVTDNQGKFVLSVPQVLLEKAFGKRSPKVHLKLSVKGTRISFSASDNEILLTECKQLLEISVKVPRAYSGDNIFLHVPTHLRSELEGIKKHGTTVTEKLKDPAAKEAFLKNPAHALAAMGVPLSRELRKRLQTQMPPRNVLTPRAFRLLNGQIITPKITVNFTQGKEQSYVG